MKTNWKIITLSFLAVFLVATIGSTFTTIDSWYELNKPSITPPNYVFPIAWTILYILIAASLYLSLVSKKCRINIKIAFVINLGLNLLWSFLFFKLKQVKLAFFDLILLWISIICLIIFTWKVDKRASVLLIPYFLWVSFAGILNYLFMT